MSQRSLEEVLADARGELPVLRKHGQSALADAIESLCNEVAEATEDYRKWLSEGDAMIRSGKSRVWLRARFGDWARSDLARWSPKNSRAREYRQIAIPQRTDVAALRADAQAAARGTEGAA